VKRLRQRFHGFFTAEEKEALRRAAEKQKLWCCGFTSADSDPQQPGHPYCLCPISLARGVAEAETIVWNRRHGWGFVNDFDRECRRRLQQARPTGPAKAADLDTVRRIASEVVLELLDG